MLQDHQQNPPIGVIVVPQGQPMGPGNRHSSNGSTISNSNSNNFADGEDGTNTARGCTTTTTTTTVMSDIHGGSHEMSQSVPSSSFMDSVAMPAPPARRPNVQSPSLLPSSLQNLPSQHHQSRTRVCAPPIGGAGFRLQPRGKPAATTPSPVNSDSTSTHKSVPSSVDNTTRGRKRGASCMGSKPSLTGFVSNRTNNGASTLTQRTLFPNDVTIHPTASSTKSPSPFRRTTVDSRNHARSMVESPQSAIQSAIQSLSIKSPKSSFDDTPSTSSSGHDGGSFLSTNREEHNSLQTEQRSGRAIGRHLSTETNTPSTSASPSSSSLSCLKSSSPMKMKASPSSPFHKVSVSSAFQSSPSPIQSFMARSRGGVDNRRLVLDQLESSSFFGSDDSPSLMKKHVPKLASVCVLQGSYTTSVTTMGTPKTTASSPGECSAPMLLNKSLLSDRSSITGEEHTIKTPLSKYEVHHQQPSSPFLRTPQSRVMNSERTQVLSTPASLHQTPQSRSTLPSPYSTPLPRTRLTPRRTPGSNDFSMLMSPRDLDLHINQTPTNESNSPLTGGSARMLSSRSPASRNNVENTLNHSWTSILDGQSSRQHRPSSPKHALPSIGSIFAPQASTDSDSADSHLKFLIGRSVTLPSSPPANFLPPIGGGAMNCDDSLTDDEDEPFVLADPAVIAQERQSESQPASDRPTRRRRMSVENEMTAGTNLVDRSINDSCKDMNISHQTSTQAVALSASQPSAAPHGSTTSLLGMAFLRGDSFGDFASGSNVVDGPIAKISDGRQALKDESSKFMSRLSSSGSLSSVGLDLDYPSTIEKNPTRDVHTPVGQMESSAPVSSPPINRLNKSYSSPGDAPSMASAMLFSQSAPTNVRMAIEKTEMPGELKNLSPPMTTCST